MGKSAPPPPPDYAKIAEGQGTLNNETALFNTNLNRADQQGPNGSVTWTTRPGADPNNPQPGDYIQTTALSPEQQGLQDSQNRISQNLAGVAEDGLNRVGQGFQNPFDTSGLPALSGTNRTPGQGLQGGPTAGPLQSRVDTANLPGLDNSYASQTKAIQDAVYAKMQPQLATNRREAETRLLNSGIEKGTQAWDDAQRNLSTAENDANLSSIVAGSQEQSRLAGLAQSARGQLFGEGSSNLATGNQAQGQAFQQGLANVGVNNSNAGLTAQQAIQNAQFNNQTRSQGMQEQAYLRSVPLNELNSLRTGAQVNAPSFGGYYTGAASSAADQTKAATDSYNAAVGNTNANNASNASTWGAVAGVATAALASY